MVTVNEKSPAYVEVTVTNTISRDLGELKITKQFDSLTSGFTGTFAINYDCDDGTEHDDTVNLLAGESQTISGIPIGTQCTVTEPAAPTPPLDGPLAHQPLTPSGVVTVSEKKSGLRGGRRHQHNLSRLGRIISSFGYSLI